MERPESVSVVFYNSPENYIDRAKRYPEDRKVLLEYILDLEQENRNLQGELETLGEPRKHLETIRKIMNIINDDVGFPVPCGANVPG